MKWEEFVWVVVKLGCYVMHENQMLYLMLFRICRVYTNLDLYIFLVSNYFSNLDFTIVSFTN